MNGESSTANFWMTQVGTRSSSEDLHDALPMRRSTSAASMGSNPAMLKAHGGPLKTGGAADAVADRTPASFSWKASENRSAVSSPEFGGFDLTFRRTPERCRHSFLGSPLLLEIFFSQNWFCLAANSCCFFLACPIQTNRSESSFVLRYRRSNALVRRLALAQSASNQGVVGWHRWRAVRHGACLSRRARSVVSYRIWCPHEPNVSIAIGTKSYDLFESVYFANLVASADTAAAPATCSVEFRCDGATVSGHLKSHDRLFPFFCGTIWTSIVNKNTSRLTYI